jgi:hypothetical protein
MLGKLFSRLQRVMRLDELPNKGMKLTKPDDLGGSWPRQVGVVEPRFAAYDQCSAGTMEVKWNLSCKSVKALVPSTTQPLPPSSVSSAT